jgi:uncharacterized protein YbbK (DUF523 family)/uncharacterized protein YbgA (DUF1722 family)
MDKEQTAYSGVRPIVVVSKCLEFEACRYNGQMIGFDFVKKLADHVTFVPVCPEVEIGLGTPRDPIKIAGDRETLSLIQPSTGKDLSAPMREFTGRFLESLTAVDGFILKSKSPSCGLKGVRIHSPETFQPTPLSARGFFAGAVLERFGGCALTDEVDLLDPQSREHWLTKLFLIARFRDAYEQGGVIFLEQFHEENRMLLLSFDLVRTKHLDRIVNEEENLSDSGRWSRYREHLYELVRYRAKRSAQTNAYIWAMTRFRDNLDSRNRSSFHQMINDCAKGRVPRESVDSLLLRWADTYSDELVRRQTFFSPYPTALRDLTVE